MHFGISRVEEDIIVRKKSPVAVIPTPKLSVPSLDVAEIGLRQLHGYVVIVEIPERVTIDRKERVFSDSSFKAEILDTAVNLIARQPVFLFELRAIALRDDSPDSELDPILVFFGLLFRCRSDRLLVTRATANSSGGKSSRKNQHQESASGVCHTIQINI